MRDQQPSSARSTVFDQQLAFVGHGRRATPSAGSLNKELGIAMGKASQILALFGISTHSPRDGPVAGESAHGESRMLGLAVGVVLPR
jgi:hypothetical protein